MVENAFRSAENQINNFNNQEVADADNNRPERSDSNVEIVHQHSIGQAPEEGKAEADGDSNEDPQNANNSSA